jgi:glycosyltransferase involved in cell wall biosynthesis
MVGQVPRRRAKGYLVASDLSLVVLRRAGLFKTVLPSKLFEAMAARVPIVLGVEGEAAALLRRARAGLCVEPENPRELADAILRLKRNEGLRGELGSNGYRAVRDHFSRGELAGRMLEVIENCAARGGEL